MPVKLTAATCQTQRHCLRKQPTRHTRSIALLIVCSFANPQRAILPQSRPSPPSILTAPPECFYTSRDFVYPTAPHLPFFHHSTLPTFRLFYALYAFTPPRPSPCTHYRLVFLLPSHVRVIHFNLISPTSLQPHFTNFQPHSKNFSSLHHCQSKWVRRLHTPPCLTTRHAPHSLIHSAASLRANRLQSKSVTDTAGAALLFPPYPMLRSTAIPRVPNIQIARSTPLK